MLSLFKRKSRIELLKEKYRLLMKRSFEMSLKDSRKSEDAHKQADKVFREIQYLSFKQADK
ncbi:Lacal_2735 family protein [Aequorivita sp. F47161]|uniref:Lacal_2735 family protein n=1 Tax=Aequorivita vitellina TaxID=2874475 RepID=A0A9X1U2L6_9FLAO|nr:Lacal_2735 family protein [Aequorivita vitellina]MCZ4317982.1 Lacal_2735 family protein [Aequorivita viscosa]